MPANSAPNNTGRSLDVFDVPIRAFLGSEIKGYGYDPRPFRPLVDVAIEEAKKLVTLPPSGSPPKFLRFQIQEEALLFLRAVLSQDKKLRSTRERIQAYSSVMLAGAGISFESGMPLARTLGDLLRFCEASSWDELRNDSVKCNKFKLHFKEICNRRAPAVSHKCIVDGFPQDILEIICLNWDNLLERAAADCKKVLPKENADRPVTSEHHLWKFHGDVENIGMGNTRGSGGWVFPGEEGYVFSSFMTYVTRTGLKDKMFTLVIVGYGEDEKTIATVIRTLEREPRRPTVRVGLELARLREEDYIVGPSDFVLKEILPSSGR